MQVDGRDQTRYEQGPRRMKVRGPAPAVAIHAWLNGAEFDFLHAEARSDAYPVIHERAIVGVRAQYWLVVDFLFADAAHDYDQRFHLAPHARGRTALCRRDDTIVCEAPNLWIAQAASSGLVAALDDGFVSERYGERRAAPVARFHRHAADAQFHALLVPHVGEPPKVHLRTLPVCCEDGPVRGAAQALSIRFGGGRDAFVDTWLVRSRAARGVCRFGSFRADGRFAMVREDAYGTVLRVHADPGGRLEEGGFPVSALEAP